MSQPSNYKFYTVRGYQLKKQNQSRLTPALEDYLEMVYRLCEEEEYTRINKLSQYLNVKPTSASNLFAIAFSVLFIYYGNSLASQHP